MFIGYETLETKNTRNNTMVAAEAHIVAVNYDVIVAAVVHDDVQCSGDDVDVVQNNQGTEDQTRVQDTQLIDYVCEDNTIAA